MPVQGPLAGCLHSGARRPNSLPWTRRQNGAAGDFLTGHLLIAMPTMEDPRFAHSVIYLCAHTPEGAMGLVLNRPLQKPEIRRPAAAA